MKFSPRIVYKTAKYGLFIALCLPPAWCIVDSYNRRQICAELPNGAILGYTAFLDPTQFLWEPYPTLKAHDGTTLIQSERHLESLSFSRTTVYGVVGPRSSLMDSEGFYSSFAYRPDVGLVLAERNGALYRKIVKEDTTSKRSRIPRGLLEYHARLFNAALPKMGEHTLIDIFIAYNYLSGDPAYRREDCPLDIFPQ